MTAFATLNNAISIVLPSLEETEKYAQTLAQRLTVPMVITLSGSIGAGKTTLMRALLRALGVHGPIKSPTYSLVETYDLPMNTALSPTPVHIHHFDLYRLTDESELEFLGFRDYFQTNSICCIEWPERIRLAPEQIDIALLLNDSGNGRTLSIQAKNNNNPNDGRHDIPIHS